MLSKYCRVFYIFNFLIFSFCASKEKYSLPDNEKFFDFLLREIASPDEIILDPRGEFCNDTIMGVSCDFSKTNLTVRIPSGLELGYGQHELEVHRPAKVLINPICVAWIHVFEAKYVTTIQDENSDTSCRTWLRIHDSNVGEISSGVVDLFIVNSEVDRIRLSNQRDFMAVNSTIKVLDHLSWKGYTGLIANTTIQELVYMRATDDLIIINSFIDKVKFEGLNFEASNLKLNNVEFGHLEHRSMQLKSGEIHIENSRFKELEQYSIVLYSGVKLLIENVDIGAAVLPAIVAPIGSSLKFVNVTLNGTEIGNVSSLVVEYEASGESNIIFIDENTQECHRSNEVLTCDFKEVSTMVRYSPPDQDVNLTQAIIRNAGSLSVIVCHINLTIENSNVTAIAMSAEAEDSSCVSSFYIRDSFVSYLNLSHCANLDIKDSHLGSFIGRNIQNLRFKNLTIDSLLNLSTKTHGSFAILDSKIRKFVRGKIKSPLLIQNTSIDTISSIRFQHDNMTSHLSNCSLYYLPSNGLRVKEGSLILSDMKFFSSMAGSIYLEAGAHLEIIGNVSLSPYAGHFITVENEGQVDIDAPTYGLDKRKFVSVRKETKEVDSFERIILKSFDNEYCKLLSTEGSSRIECDFAGFAEQVEVKITEKLPHPETTLRLANIRYLILHPVCLIEVALFNITAGRSISKLSSCSNVLVVENSHLEEVREGWMVLHIDTSSIEYISISHNIKEMSIDRSNITSIEDLRIDNIYKSLISRSRIANITFLTALGPLEIIDSSLGVINSFGLIAYSTVEIVGCTIEFVEQYGVIIHSDTTISNSTFHSLDDAAFVVHEHSLDMENIIIEKASLRALYIRSGTANLKEVTIDGRSVVLPKQLVWKDQSENTSASINSSAHVSTSTSSSTTPLTTTTTITTTTSSSTIEGQPQMNVTSTPKQEPKANLEESSSLAAVGWAGAAVGFFIGVITSVAIMTVIQVFKDDRKLLAPFHIKWKVNDDQDDLMSSEDEMDIRSAIRDGF